MVCNKNECEGKEVWECWWDNSPCPKDAFARGKREGAEEERKRIVELIEKIGEDWSTVGGIEYDCKYYATEYLVSAISPSPEKCPNCLGRGKVGVYSPVTGISEDIDCYCQKKEGKND